MNLKFDSAILYVRDINKAKKFYTEKLGFVIDHDDDNYVSLRVSEDDPVEVALNAEKKKGHFSGHQTIVLKTDNIKKVYKKFKNNEVPIKEKMVQKNWGKTFTIFDLDGNRVEVLEYPKEK